MCEGQGLWLLLQVRCEGVGEDDFTTLVADHQRSTRGLKKQSEEAGLGLM